MKKNCWTLAAAAIFVMHSKFAISGNYGAPDIVNPELAISIREPARSTFQVGDKLKVSFYEPFNNDKDKWTAGNKLPGPSFYLHGELSGDYTIDSDWTISVPLIGNIDVADRTASQVQSDLTKAFEAIIGHPGFVQVVIAERRPIYVVGAVKTPGVYKFVPGLTPLHLVALAGGMQRTDNDQWATVEALRVAGSEKASLDRLRRVLAETAVLKSELEGVAVTVPQELAELSDRQAAENMVEAEVAKRKPVLQAREGRSRLLQLTIAIAQHAVDIDNERLQPLQDNIKIRRARLASFQTLFSERNAAQTMVAQAQADLSDSVDRRATALSSIVEDQRRLEVAKVDASKFEEDTRTELNTQIAARQREIDELTPAITASEGVIKLLRSRSASYVECDTGFSVVRAGNVLRAGITTILEPGDVLRVVPSPYKDDARDYEAQGPKILSQSDPN